MPTERKVFAHVALAVCPGSAAQCCLVCVGTCLAGARGACAGAARRTRAAAAAGAARAHAHSQGHAGQCAASGAECAGCPCTGRRSRTQGRSARAGRRAGGGSRVRCSASARGAPAAGGSGGDASGLGGIGCSGAPPSAPRAAPCLCGGAPARPARKAGSRTGCRSALSTHTPGPVSGRACARGPVQDVRMVEWRRWIP